MPNRFIFGGFPLPVLLSIHHPGRACKGNRGRDSVGLRIPQQALPKGSLSFCFANRLRMTKSHCANAPGNQRASTSEMRSCVAGMSLGAPMPGDTMSAGWHLHPTRPRRRNRFSLGLAIFSLRLNRLARLRIQDQFAGSFVLVVVCEVEHLSDGACEAVETALADALSTEPVVLDETQHGGLVGDAVIDEIALGPGRNHE